MAWYQEGYKGGYSSDYSYFLHLPPPLKTCCLPGPAARSAQSTALPLLIRTPNGVHAAGTGRDRYVPNPGATSAVQVEMFVFLGKIMGHAMRWAGSGCLADT